MFFFFCVSKQSTYHFIKLRVIQWSHMDFFNDVFTTFLDLESGSSIGSLWRDQKLSDFIKKILICVLKMNEDLSDVEWHKCEWLMTEF